MRVLLALYLAGMLIMAVIATCVMCTVLSNNQEDKVNDGVSRSEEIALAAVVVLAASVGWVPLLILVLRSAWMKTDSQEQ